MTSEGENSPRAEEVLDQGLFQIECRWDDFTAVSEKFYSRFRAIFSPFQQTVSGSILFNSSCGNVA